MISLTETHLAARYLIYMTEARGTWSKPERLGREGEADGLPDRDLRRLGRDDQGQADALEDLADGRPILSLMLKPRSLKLTRH